MGRRSKYTSLFLALVMTLGAAAPAVSYARPLLEDDAAVETDAEDSKARLDLNEPEKKETIELTEGQKLEIAEVRADLTKAVKSVEGIEAPDEKYEKQISQFKEAGKRLDEEITEYEQNLKQGNSISRQKDVGGSIYDLTTIPVRIQLLIRIGRAIRFGSTELSNKVVAAHTKLGEYITVGILFVLNPFASEQQILDYINQFEELEKELLQYPDLTPQDIATIYKKAAYHRTIDEARKVRNEANRSGRRFQAKELDKVIAKSVGLWWRITVTCGELDEQEKVLQEAIERVAGPKVRVKKIEFMEGNAGALNVDKRAKITPVILPAEVKNQNVILYSSNSYVARVVGGDIVPLKTGSVKITAVALDNGTKGYFDLTILNPGEYSESLPMLKTDGDSDAYLNTKNNTPKHPVYTEKTEVKDLSFTLDVLKLSVGQQTNLAKKVLVFPDRAIDKSLHFRSLNDAVVTVDEKGQVIAHKAGKTQIEVKSANGIAKKLTVTVTDPALTPVYKITNVTVSDRKAGIFKVAVEATKNGQAYTGPAKVVVSSGEKSITKTVYLQKGKGSVSYNGFEFGVWRKEFRGEVQLKEAEQVFEAEFR